MMSERPRPVWSAEMLFAVVLANGIETSSMGSYWGEQQQSCRRRPKWSEEILVSTLLAEVFIFPENTVLSAFLLLDPSLQLGGHVIMIFQGKPKGLFQFLKFLDKRASLLLLRVQTTDRFATKCLCFQWALFSYWFSFSFMDNVKLKIRFKKFCMCFVQKRKWYFLMERRP